MAQATPHSLLVPVCRVYMIAKFASYLRYELNRSEHTVNAYVSDLLDFSKSLHVPRGEMNPADVETDDIRSWIAERTASGLSPFSIRRGIQSLKAFYKFLMRRGIVSHDPTAGIVPARAPKPLPYAIPDQSMDEYFSLPKASSLKSIRNRLIVEMLYGLGLRRAEIVSVNDSDVDFSQKTIRIHGKRRKIRILPLPSKLADNIREYMRLRSDNTLRDPSDPLRPLFSIKGKRISPALVYSIITSELKDLGVKKTNPHILRHSFATTMLNHGADMNSLKEMLGHSSLSSTQIYTHLSFNQMKEAYDHAHPRNHDASPRLPDSGSDDGNRD